MKTLHILNGDGTAAPFSKSKLAEEDTLIWREAMMEGPIHESKDFWRTRGLYFSKMYKRYGESASSYFKKVIQENAKLEKLSEYTHVVLWFEFDVFCQINLLFLLNHLSGLEIDHLQLSVVSPGQEQEGANFHGMGEGTPEKIEQWYSQRVEVSDEMLKKAQELWKVYNSDTPEQLDTIVSAGEIEFFPHLRKSFAAHLSRYPSFKNGLNTIEQALLDIIEEKKPTKIGHILRPFWELHSVYGLGDSQLVNYLEKLSPMLVTFNGESIKAFTEEQVLDFNGEIELTELGKAVRAGNRDWLEYGYPNEWLGGVHLAVGKPLYRWQPD